MNEDALDKIYDDLKQMRDEVKLKLHLGGMGVRDEVEKLDLEWENWTHQLSRQLKAEGEDLEAKIREAGGEDLKKAEIATNLAIAKLKSGLQGVVDKLKDSDRETRRPD
jgi:hypothetical protein